MTGKFLVGVAVAVVVLILLAGLYTLVAGSETGYDGADAKAFIAKLEKLKQK